MQPASRPAEHQTSAPRMPSATGPCGNERAARIIQDCYRRRLRERALSLIKGIIMARESSPHPHASAFGVNSAGAKATLQLLADYGGDLARLARLEDHNSALGVLFLADRTAAAAWQTESTVCDKLQWVLPSKEEMEQVCVCVSVCLPACPPS